jgi:membrane protein
MSLKGAASLLWETFREWLADGAMVYSAAMSYRVLLALAPSVIIAVAVLEIITLGTTVFDDLVEWIDQQFGQPAAEAVQSMVDSFGAQAGSSIVALIISGAFMLYMAASAFRMLRKALDAMWRVEWAPLQTDARHIRTQASQRLVPFALALSLGVALAAMMALSALWGLLSDSLRELLPVPELVARVADFAFTLGVATAVFAGLLAVVPLGRLPRRDLWLAALLTAVLFNIGKLGFGIYMSHSSTASLYGAAGTIVIFLIWVYYSSWIVFFGAKFAVVIARHRGCAVQPRAGARLVS